MENYNSMADNGEINGCFGTNTKTTNFIGAPNQSLTLSWFDVTFMALLTFPASSLKTDAVTVNSVKCLRSGWAGGGAGRKLHYKLK